jgi:epoxyqueuosine reductase
VKARAIALGFSAAGITDPAATPHANDLQRWLDAGMAGTMRYLHRQASHRVHPQRIMDEARAVVVLLYNYAHEEPAEVAGSGKVAKYARGPDYHRALQPALEALSEYIVALGGPGTSARPFVDAGPVPERELAQRAGLGWIGKNTMLIHPGMGSFTLIASVFTSAVLAADTPFAADRCGTCTRCLDACPTGAFPSERVLDARLCVSYLTIEFRGDVDDPAASRMGNRIFGCDDCQDVCPWNRKFAREQSQPLLRMDPDRAWIPLDAFAALDTTAFDAQFGWTPLERPGLHGMRRNAGIAARNARRKTRVTGSPKPTDVSDRVAGVRARLEDGLPSADPHHRLQGRPVAYRILGGPTLEIVYRDVPRIEESEVLAVKRLLGAHCHCTVEPQTAETLVVRFVMSLESEG